MPGDDDAPFPHDPELVPDILRPHAIERGFRIAAAPVGDDTRGPWSGTIGPCEYLVTRSRGAVYAVSLELRLVSPDFGAAEIDVRRGARPWLRRDLVIGDPSFDEQFVVASSTPDLLSIWLDPDIRAALERTGDATNPRPCRLRIAGGAATVSSALRPGDTAEATCVLGVLDAIRGARDHVIARWNALADAVGGELEGPTWPLADGAQLRIVRPRGEATLMWRRGPLGKRFVTLVMVELSESPPATPPELLEALSRMRAAVAELDDRISISMPGIVDDPRRADSAIEIALDIAARDEASAGPYR